MSSSLRRGALAAAAIAFSIASLSACAAGHNAQSLQVQPDNAATTVGDIKIQNAVVITQPDLESTGPAVVSATLFNSGDTDQTLDSVTLPGTGKTAALTPAEGGSLTVPAGGSLILGGKGNAAAVLPSSRESVRDGNAQKVTFAFSETGDVSLRAFVVPAESFYEEWGPSDVPAAPGASTEPSAESSDKPADKPGDTPENRETDPATETDPESGTPTDAASASTQPND
ncbi:lipoprotein [Streptomyces sp. KM77-8]|uniref:Lipoprotein n=1 Tax=Streptomyces haneummycinicus TaxID=3074435 RepID=A0AAT9HZC6_9ACTN